MGMNGCNYFKCDGCSKFKPIEEQNIFKASFTIQNHLTDEKFLYNVHHIQLCNKCIKEGNEE